MSKESSGIAWSTIQVVSIKGASFFFSIWIARLVDPEAYALIAMVTVFISFFQLFVDGGLANALIQKKDREEIDYSTVFISNLVISVAIYVLLYMCAPLISSFYNQAELTNIVRIISLSVIINALSIIQKCRLTIQLNFSKQAIAGVISTFVSGIIGVVLAYRGWAVWSLVIMTLVGNIGTTVVLILLSHWKPHLEFSWPNFKRLFNYGSRDLIGNIFTSFFSNVYNLVIGRLYSPVSLAFYNRGFSLGFMPAGMIQESISRISFPILCENQSNQSDLIIQYKKYLSLNSYVAFPIMCLLAIFATSLIQVMLTDKWIQAGYYTSIFAFAFMTHPILVCMGQIVNAAGYPGKNVKLVFVKRMIGLLILLFTANISVRAIAIGLLISNYIEVFLSAWLVSRIFQIGILSQLKCIIKVLTASLITCVVGVAFESMINNAYITISLGIPTCVLNYILLTYLFRMNERHFINLLLSKIRIIFLR